MDCVIVESDITVKVRASVTGPVTKVPYMDSWVDPDLAILTFTWTGGVWVTSVVSVLGDQVREDGTRVFPSNAFGVPDRTQSTWFPDAAEVPQSKAPEWLTEVIAHAHSTLPKLVP